MKRVSSRIGNIEPSATMAISAKANELRAQGRDVVSFGAGEPDFATPSHIVEAAVAATHDPVNHHYSAAGGRQELKDAVAFKTTRDSGYQFDPAQVVVTNGAKQAIFNALAVLLDDGDEALIPAPYWVTYPEAVKLAGGTPVVVDSGDDFKVSAAMLEAARTARTRALVLASPSNPTGIVYSPEELSAIGRWAVEHGVWVVTDEIYEHLVYEAPFASLPVVVPEVVDQCIVVNGVAKSYAMTGWRVGWLIGPPDVAKAASSLMSHSTSNVNNIAQIAAAAALEGPLDEVHAMRRVFDKRRKTMHQMLATMNGVTCQEPQGAFYCFPDVRALLGRSVGGTPVETSLDLAAALLDTAETAVVPGEAFGAPGYLRLSYALGDDDLVRGLTRIGEALA